MSEANVENCRRIFRGHFPEHSERTRTISVPSIKSRWKAYREKSGVPLYHDNIGDLTVEDEDTFTAHLCTLNTHQSLFPAIGQKRSRWRSVEIRDVLFELLDELKAHSRMELVGIDALEHLLLRPQSVRGKAQDTICLLAGSTFVGKGGYLNIPSTSKGQVVSSPALHNPMRPEYSFLIGVS